MPDVWNEIALGRNRVRAALVAADGLSSQQVGENVTLSESLLLPPAVVAASPEKARQEQTYKRILEDEAFVLWAQQRKENAALARDDTDGLSGVFSTAKAFGESVANFGNRAMHWATFEAADDVRDMSRSLIHGAADFNRSLLGGAQALSDNLFGVGSAPSRMLASAQEWVKWARPKEVKSDTLLGQLGYGFVRSVPQQLGNILAALSNPAVALSLMGVQLGGGSYAELREQGVTPQRAFVSSLANAVMQAPLEKLSLDRFMGIFRSSSFRDTLVRALGASATEGLTEYVQTYPELAARLWGLAEKTSSDAVEQMRWFGKTITDAEVLRQAHNEGMYAMAIGSMWGALGGGVRVLASRQARQQAQAFAEQNTALHDAVEASQTKQIAPEYMEDALDNASDVLAQSVYIPAQAALDLAGQGRDVLTPLGITLEDAQKAAASGVDLEVKLSRVHARLDSAGMTAMNDILRQTPGAPNLRELSLIDADDEVQAAISDARQRRRRTEAVRQEEQRLVREMVPLVGKEAAETYGKLNSAQARAFEAAYGVDAAGLMRRRSVGLEDTGKIVGTSFDQTAYHGTPHKFKNFSLEHIGTGERAQAHGWGLYFAQDRKVSEDYRNRLRTGRSRGQLFEVDIPENDVLVDEQKSFGEQPDAVKQALLAVYKSFPKERLAIVREEAKAQVGRDRALVEKGDKLGLERQQLFNQRRALKTVNAERPAGTNPFDPKSSAKLFDLGRDYLRQMYSPEQIARLENDAGYLAAEKAALKEKLDDVARKIGENERRIEEKRKKDRDAIDRARLGTLLAKMDGASLYSGISAMADSPRAASELLNAHGIRGITYDGGQDGRSFVVFDDKAIDVLKTFYQPEVDAVPYPNNGRAVGSISPEIASTLRLDKPGAIVLDDIGLQHIEDRHGKEIRGLGFADARAFVDAVLADVSAVYDVDGGGRKYDLVSRTMTPQGRVMVRLEFAETGDFYSIATAGTVRKKYYEKKLPLWESANLNHSPKGTPDATFSGQSGMRQDAAGKISLAIGNREVNGDARARVTFDAAEGGRAIIEFFSAADASSAPHELYHIFRREMAESAARPDAPQRVREDWARIEEFVGAEPGQTWTRAMEEKFARAGERFLLEGKAPTPALQGVFERLRQWFLELYANADAAGLHISPAMREVFGNMLSVPAEQGDMAFRKALGELLSRPVDPVEPAAVPPLP